MKEFEPVQKVNTQKSAGDEHDCQSEEEEDQSLKFAKSKWRTLLYWSQPHSDLIIKTWLGNWV